MNGAELIAAERQRQIEKEGWSAEHDEVEHKFGDLSRAAICYIAYGLPNSLNGLSVLWPWAWKWFKPQSRLRNLVRAGALIAAEIDKYQKENGGGE